MKNSLATNYDIGKELGIEARKRLEKNLKRYVIAGVIATGYGVLFIILKLPLYIDFIAAFSSYLIANYCLSKLFKKNPSQLL
jgi:putative flippase GtrA